jgi:ribosomal protein S18 acetylase RimI-like enzyme
MSEEAIRLRRGHRDDAPALADFAARTFAETFGPDNDPADMALHLTSKYGVARQTQELTDPDYLTLLMEEADGRLIAYAQVRRSVPPECVTTDGPVELHRFYVDASFHGRGLAAGLMDAVLDAAAELGGRSLWLNVWSRNARAIRFYEKCGYREVGSIVFHLGSDPQHDLVLARILAPDQPLVDGPG